MENELSPAPDEINIETGKCMWIIDGYKIWANSYMEALEMLPIIQSI